MFKGNHHPLHIYTVDCCSSYTKLRDDLFGQGLVEVLETLVAIMFTFLRNCSAGGCLNKTNENVMQLVQNYRSMNEETIWYRLIHWLITKKTNKPEITHKKKKVVTGQISEM